MGCVPSKSNQQIQYAVPATNELPKVGETCVYRNPEYPYKTLDGLHRRWSDIKDLQSFYIRVFKTYSDKHLFRVKNVPSDLNSDPWKYLTYKECLEISEKVGSAIMGGELAPIVNESNVDYRFVGLYSKNRAEWLQIDIACALYGITTLPFYDTLGSESVKFIFEQTGVQTVFCAGDKVENLIKGAIAGNYKSLKHIVSFDPVDQNLVALGMENKVVVRTFTELLDLGKTLYPYPKVTGDTIHTFCYTSGTTDTPKAAMISHSNFLAELGCLEELPGFTLEELGPGERIFSYLPLAHTLERIFVHVGISRGFVIGFFSGDIKKLKDEVSEFKPTLFAAVPRVLNKFYDTIMEKLNAVHEEKGFKSDLIKKAVETKLENLRSEGVYTHAIYDLLIFNKMRDALGGEVKRIFSGGAPLAPEVHDFLRIAFCCPLSQGYGLTETTCAAFFMRPGDGNSGICGGPVAACEYKLVDIPDMNYRSIDKDADGKPAPRGEVCLRGGIIFKGYYKQEKLTKEAIDQDGFFHTGDVGTIESNGSLKIIDRKKNIFKLAQGEYIAPEKIENAYLRCELVAEAFVYGDSFHAFLVGVVVPHREKLVHFAENLGVKGEEYEKLCQNEKVVEGLLKEMIKAGEAAKLLKFEQVKRIHVEPNAFNSLDLCTPSLKLKRAPAKNHYIDIINKFYAEKIDM